ncbi:MULTISPECIES: amidase domain-containing protein [Acinetobacter]|uniref:amidase domain-containing protein n=1 Tax=Acinetobacter TaxID=469 RepID=UPI001478B63E|nr:MULTISPECIES: amidase domain-containing protein [Acinetobacter]MDQ9948732.1 amidase domain-containing protein [Acinetobacter sp. 12966]
MNKSNIIISLFIILVSNSVSAAYTPSTAVSYAVNNYNLLYSTTSNPFINVSDKGGNCTNFANQTISGGLLGITNSKTLNQTLLSQSAAVKAVQNTSVFYKCNTTGNTCQTIAWRGAQPMFTYSANSTSLQSKGVRLNLVTKTTLVNGTLSPLDLSKIRVGDIVYLDFNFVIGGSSNSVDHTAVVTAVNPESWYDVTQTMKYNNIKLTYQSYNTTNKGLGDMNAPAIYIYRPFV